MEDWIFQIVAASIGATISGLILLHTHHSRVEKELDLHRKIEVFEKKQQAYREVLTLISKMSDHLHFLGKGVNWRILRHVYNEILLVGTPEVVKLSNDLIIQFDVISVEKRNEMIKQLWNSIREDLYGKSLLIKDMHLITPSPDTIDGLRLYNKHLASLKESGIDTLEKAKEMKIEQVHSKTGIDLEELKSIKNMADNEFLHEEELKKFLRD